VTVKQIKTDPPVKIERRTRVDIVMMTGEKIDTDGTGNIGTRTGTGTETGNTTMIEMKRNRSLL
jgi:hypothetical protein